MTIEKTMINYWFTIEPYVYIGLTGNRVLLYNTLDKQTIESDKTEVIKLISETLQKENCGVCLLTDNKFQDKNIFSFIMDLRDRFMGDIINVDLSNGRPIQPLPYFNFISADKSDIYRKNNFPAYSNILDNLCEISITIDQTTQIDKLILFLQSVPTGVSLYIIVNISQTPCFNELLSYLDKHQLSKNIICSYKDIVHIDPSMLKKFSYYITVDFPIDMTLWMNSRHVLLNQKLPCEYNFNVKSSKECLEVENIVEQFQIEQYKITPAYTGENISFFEDNIFLTKEDILDARLTIKDIFSHHSINIHDFGKINIMSNGDAYANCNNPVIGNIYKDSIYEIVYNEVEKGKSWFRIRNQEPCNQCVYQWLCPSPSDYEIVIGRSNLCHIHNNRKL